MATSNYNVSRLRCDRCENVLVCEEYGYDQDKWRAERNKWGEIRAQTKGGGFVQGTRNGYQMDLCTDCMTDLIKWIGRQP